MRYSTASLLLYLNAPSFVLSESQQPLTLKKSKLDIPAIGLGLWNSKGDDATDAVKYAFEAGYTHFDSAAAYSNEDKVGEGLADKKSLKREKYWITSKLWNDMHQPDNVPTALNATLTDLGVDYIDLYLMHWPVAFLPGQKEGHSIIDQDTKVVDTWKAMEKLVAKNTSHPARGTTRYIGVSNFSPRQLDDILKICKICPYAHEFETHPYLQQTEFVDWHQEHNIKVIAYSPLANTNPTYQKKYPDLPPILEDKFWLGLSKAKNITVAQAILGWGMQRNTVVIPKSTHQDRIEENLKAVDVKFSDEEMNYIAQQDKRSRFNDPSKSWGVELFEGLDDGSNRFLA